MGILCWAIWILWFYDNIAWRWDWVDFFLAILMIILWLIFLPFTYSRQEKLWWASIYTIEFLPVIMFLIFIPHTFSLLQTIFQGDFTLTFIEIINVIIVISRRATFLPKQKISRKKFQNKNFSSLWRKRIFITLIVGWITAIIIDLSTSNNFSSTLIENEDWSFSVAIENNNSNQTCLGNQQKIQNDDRIDAYITTSEIPQKWKTTQNTFTTTEILGLSYYIEWKSDTQQYYINREICNLDTNQTIEKIMSDGWLPIEEIFPGADGWLWGNTSPFNNIKHYEPWNYSLNIFTSNDDKNWQLVKKLWFTLD